MSILDALTVSRHVKVGGGMRGTGVLRAPIVQIINGTFQRDNVPIFRDLSLTIQPHEKWSVLSKSSSARTSLLQVIRGQHVCVPLTARTYPLLSQLHDQRLQSAHNAIQYVGFDAERGKGAMRGGYMSARYESLREETDFSLLDFLNGNTDLNPDETLARHPDPALLRQIMADLKLHDLSDMPVMHLSNGQTRRSKIAKALLSKPELLLLDGPFMGLDPPTLKHLSQLLGDMAEKQAPRLVLSLKPDEHIPDWITHMAFVTQQHQLAQAGPRKDVIQFVHNKWQELRTISKSIQSSPLNEEAVEYAEVSRHLWAHTPTSPAFEDRREELAYHRERAASARQARSESESKPEPPKNKKEIISRDGFRTDTRLPAVGEPLIEMEGVKVQYGNKIVLGNWQQDLNGQPEDGLHWTVCRGQRWGVFGPNGSGKTTLISLITSDHPQTYSLPIKLFGRARLPEAGQPGISIFDLQKRIGHSSPEVHVYFPKHLSIRRTIESAWADTPLTKPKLTFDIDEKVNAALMWFRGELVPSLGPPKWMRAEMDRAVPGIDGGFFDPTRHHGDSDRAAYHMRQAEQAIAQERQDFENETWPDDIKFGELNFSAQRVALFIRAVIRNPDLVVLDEAFSGMDDFARDKCQLFLSQGENAIYHLKRLGNAINSPKVTQSDMNRLGMVQVEGLQDSQALIIVSHKKEEVPGCVRDWICLPESGAGPPRSGKLDAPLELGIAGWSQIWGEQVARTAEARSRRLKKKQMREATEGWPSETPEERHIRLERVRQQARKLEGIANHPGAATNATPRGKSRRRGSTEEQATKARLRLLAKVRRDAESQDELERRRAQLRIRWQARLEQMAPEERKLFQQQRSSKYFKDRPDRVARHRELCRQARARYVSKFTEAESQERRELARQRREEKLASMSAEQVEAIRNKRRARHEARMADPVYAEKFRNKIAEAMRRLRERRKKEATTA